MRVNSLGQIAQSLRTSWVRRVMGVRFTTLETKLCGVLRFKTFALSLRSRRQHKAWGVSPRGTVVKRSAAHEVVDS